MLYINRLLNIFSVPITALLLFPRLWYTWRQTALGHRGLIMMPCALGSGPIYVADVGEDFRPPGRPPVSSRQLHRSFTGRLSNRWQMNKVTRTQWKFWGRRRGMQRYNRPTKIATTKLLQSLAFWSLVSLYYGYQLGNDLSPVYLKICR